MDIVMIPLIGLSAALGTLALGFGLFVFEPPTPKQSGSVLELVASHYKLKN
ncbi:hypothetical protein [Candidatus Entotheonella palauensis]|uniref:hypothetical protein n=1 Tax=Candidatus Entotheonella palauensis TaxID=93172 RepID=UPI0015C41E45|nr:hypothetical protein [Candidatus Entotheonella palauensis]